MSEIQPDMLGGKAVPGSRLRRIRRTGKAPVAREGWADKPGSGPEGETCGSCTYCEAFHYRKRYYKCAAREGDHWKGGRATDIRPLDPACSKWAPSVNRANQQKAQPVKLIASPMVIRHLQLMSEGQPVPAASPVREITRPAAIALLQQARPNKPLPVRSV